MHPNPSRITRIASLKTAGDFRRHLAALGLELPCDETILTRDTSPLAQPLPQTPVNGKTISNRIAIHPMEGWDGLFNGVLSEEVRRRWRHFGESGAGLIFGGEAMAVRPDGRANPHQLLCTRDQIGNLTCLREQLAAAHRARYGGADSLVIGFQLTHSGRFARPNDMHRAEPRIACRHPLLDQRVGVTNDAAVLSDTEMDALVGDYAGAAAAAEEAGADFVDIKHCHGYLLHEFLSAFHRPGKYGGSFENRTRPLREIVRAIRARGVKIDLAVRLSAFDLIPFHPDPKLSQPGRPGPGVPENYSQLLPYRRAFGVNPDNPLEYDLTEPLKFVELCGALGVKLLNVSGGSPYYNPHIQRPAAYPPSDAYQPPNDPLIDVARQIQVARRIKAGAPRGMIVIGSCYSYLQEYLPQVAQAVVRAGWTDMVGIGRAVLSYPTMIADALDHGTLNTRSICRTFSECTTAPRNGMVSGCYPLDPFYAARQDFKDWKKFGRKK
jgi:2,4-dienoyl-CoA reductase-like NADH-dependent reductase (Old Yellow Enzyme family)